MNEENGVLNEGLTSGINRIEVNLVIKNDSRGGFERE